jgi:Recombination endonuclease VII
MKHAERQEAQTRGAIYYSTGKPCKQGHISDRRTTTGRCLVCEREYQQTHPQKEYHRKLKQSEKYRQVARRRLEELIGTEKYRNQTRLTHLKRKYGITEEQHTEMYESQNGQCAICSNLMVQINTKQRSNSCVVDHNHQTGKVRSLLCGKCNRMLGQANDNPTILQSAIEYLKRFS